jgi:formylmethanofuran--tetrahydromethanopterin N-formyltransferase
LEGNRVEVEDTYAEAFEGYYARLIVTALSEKWAEHAVREATSYATSMVGCSSEAGIEGIARDTPDGRPGYVIQIWAPKKRMKDELLGRIGQCILTTPTTAVWNHGASEEKLDIGYKMRYYGDGYEELRSIAGRKMVAIPVMSGEFLIEREFSITKGVMGGNFFILADSQSSALKAAEKASGAIHTVGSVITPFPGGVCGAGSKVGSTRYKFMHATTNEVYCPTIVDRVRNSKVNGIGGVAEIVIDGISEDKVREAMSAGIKAALGHGGVKRISAGNYGGTLGNVIIRLRDLI